MLLFNHEMCILCAGVKKYGVSKIERPSALSTLCLVVRFAPVLILSMSHLLSKEGGLSVIGHWICSYIGIIASVCDIEISINIVNILIYFNTCTWVCFTSCALIKRSWVSETLQK